MEKTCLLSTISDSKKKIELNKLLGLITRNRAKIISNYGSYVKGLIKSLSVSEENLLLTFYDGATIEVTFPVPLKISKKGHLYGICVFVDSNETDEVKFVSKYLLKLTK